MKILFGGMVDGNLSARAAILMTSRVGRSSRVLGMLKSTIPAQEPNAGSGTIRSRPKALAQSAKVLAEAPIQLAVKLSPSR